MGHCHSGLREDERESGTAVNDNVSGLRMVEGDEDGSKKGSVKDDVSGLKMAEADEGGGKKGALLSMGDPSGLEKVGAGSLEGRVVKGTQSGLKIVECEEDGSRKRTVYEDNVSGVNMVEGGGKKGTVAKDDRSELKMVESEEGGCKKRTVAEDDVSGLKMVKREEGGRNKGNVGLLRAVLSWSLDDILDQNFFKAKVEKIPKSFESVHQYFDSFTFPLLEETRAQLYSSMETISEAPFAEVIDFQKSKQKNTNIYDIGVDYWRNRLSDHGKEPYKTLPGDILILTDVKPENVSDLQRLRKTWVFIYVIESTDDMNESYITSIFFKARAAKDINEIKRSKFVIFLTNITCNRRIWNCLHKHGNLSLIKKVLGDHSLVDENCELCYTQNRGIWNEKFTHILTSILNDSQMEAINACLRRLHCNHKSGIELVWGLPGTGKTKTVSMLLFALLKMKCRAVVCAPTNVAIIEVASRVLKLVKESFQNGDENNSLLCPLGDILLFGDKERLKLGKELEEIYLDYRIQRLSECLEMLTGWRNLLTLMIDFLEECVSDYHNFVQNELLKQNKTTDKNEFEGKELSEEAEVGNGIIKSFLEFVRERFTNLAAPLRRCISVFSTHISISYKLFQEMVGVTSLLDSLRMSLFKDNVVSEELKEAFSRSPVSMSYLSRRRHECLSSLKNLRDSLNVLDLPFTTEGYALRDFCYENASLIFCTASSLYKLQSAAVKPWNILVIDEAAQLKESETIIPLQLRGLKHAILIGDNFQLSAMVQSNICDEAGLGRSLFERLSSLGHPKHLLDVQYRMHPKISFFPNLYFYRNQICDGPNVQKRGYRKEFLPGPMFGQYSFININDGREEFDNIGHSIRNFVEVSVVMKILHKLHRAWTASKQNVSIGVITTYTAQVVAIEERLSSKYDDIDGFSVKVGTVDGFQGGEKDIIIASTVRSNGEGSIGFIMDPQRTNVTLTRARHCLWVLGNERTLTRHESVWKDLVYDAKSRECFFNADDDKDLAKAILDVKKAFDELDQLLNPESMLLRSQRWKVVFSENFLKSLRRIRSDHTKKLVINLLLRLANGWRPKRRKVDFVCEGSKLIVKKYKVEDVYLICTNDIIEKGSLYMQVLKIWDMSSLEDFPKLVKRLDNIFIKYTGDYITCCNKKSLERNLEVPMIWEVTSNMFKHKMCTTIESGNSSSDSDNLKVNESLLLMKFYSLSSGIVNHLLSDLGGRELELPFEVTDEELEITLYPKSTFILGRSGTGKTTILTLKMFQKEKLHHFSVEKFFGYEGSIRKSHNVTEREAVEKEIDGEKKAVLHQLFVTVSPKVCFAVKQHITQLKSSVLGENLPADGSFMDIDDSEQFKNIQNSFVDMPPESFPLVITFQKFLMMLDGTIGTSYFARFHDLREYFSQPIQGSVAIEAFIRKNEVSYDRFSSSYWPHFNKQLAGKLDSSRVFTEIISHIKGGFQAVNFGEGKLSREDYVQLSESRSSNLSKSKREKIYGIFENYERMKAQRGEFDLSDLVLDLHWRLKNRISEGDVMDFVYIDEVQDMTMSQIALFKYICKNVKEGFVFSGDTAQTIARGIDFRFQDVRSLFYNSFLMGSEREKGKMSKIFNLSQNFRTHAGILKLSQSVLDLLYRYFPQSIDILKPETSHIYLSPPVLLESLDNEDALTRIFRSSGNASGKIVGFGAEQVILVRDDNARKEITDHVGKQALVMTILECKGLEFQDVLLCNFFSKSPLKDQWRVIYGYMKDQDLDDIQVPKCPNFSEARHHILCAELKQLYVAISRTRQRLWIWENDQEVSKPMFDYWKNLHVVQVKQLDDTVVRDMQVESSTEEWRSRGIKLFQEQHYEYATMCFERAGDTYWGKKSKATHLKGIADRIRSSSPEEANNILREAAELFDAIGRATSAAECFNEAAKIAKQRGDLLLASDLLEKAGNLKEASELLLNLVLHNSLWAHGSSGWPLMQFMQKGELLQKAKNLAKQYSDKFYRFVCSETKILSNQQRTLSMISQQLNESRRYQSVRGEILSARKILEIHLDSNISNFGWENYLIEDPLTYSKHKFSKNEVSIETLVYFWNYWKNKIMTVLQSLEHLETNDISKYRIYGDFCLDYLGVLKHEAGYFLLKSDAEWLRGLDGRFA